MGQYEASIAVFNNLLKDFPDTHYKEEILVYILRSYYHYALKSVSHMQDERLQSAIDSYNELTFQFPDTEYMKEVDNMRNNVLKRLND